MRFQLIRSATLRLAYGGHLILIDPFLADQEALPPFAGNGRNPTVGLPIAVADVLADVELVIVSHLHSDHFDEAAARQLDKGLPLLCQPGDEESLAAKGFREVAPVSTSYTWNGIHVQRTEGRHGTGEWAKRMGAVSGFVLAADGEPTVYWMGDTVWYEGVQAVVQDVQPDIIITHSSGARFGDGEPIVMDSEQTTAVCAAAPDAVVIAVHLESLDHGTVSRADLRQAAEAKGIAPARLLIPEDGEQFELPLPGAGKQSN